MCFSLPFLISNETLAALFLKSLLTPVDRRHFSALQQILSENKAAGFDLAFEPNRHQAERFSFLSVKEKKKG